MNKILALLLAGAAAVALWFAPQAGYAGAAADILHPYAASVEEQAGQLRERLSEANRQLYDVVKKGLLDHDSEIVVRRIGYEEEDVWNVVYSISYDSPELFWVDFRTLSFRDTNEGFAVIPTYFVEAQEAASMQTEFDAACDALLARLDEQSYTDDYDKLLFLHDALIAAVQYDESAAETVIHTAYGALVPHTAVCDGYARAFHALCLRAGLECYYVEGTANSGAEDVGHAWNIVRVGEAAHNIDVTWDDGDYELVDDSVDFSVVSHAYFLVSDEALAATHKADARIELPACTDYGYFEKAGLSAAAFADIKNAAADALFYNVVHGGRYCVEFRITDSGEFDKVIGSYEYAVDGLIKSVNTALKSNGLTLIDEFGRVSFSYQKQGGVILAVFTPQS